MGPLRRLVVEVGGFVWWLWWVARSLFEAGQRVRYWQRQAAAADGLRRVAALGRDSEPVAALLEGSRRHEGGRDA